MSKKRPSMLDIQLDAGVVTLPGAQAPAAGASPKAGAGGKEDMEKFQLYIPREIATEIRVEGAKRGKSNSALMLEAWEMWKANPPESH